MSTSSIIDSTIIIKVVYEILIVMYSAKQNTFDDGILEVLYTINSLDLVAMWLLCALTW